ncbi:hypothetical protein LVJ94_27775 [Pendulispora rubella]|uniref:Coenzyme PQQ synthesis protein A n=1 Tax=Pendulispora rubella TaxID=2741070 RepID=A0ABZ2KPX3_9BACT
MHWTTPSLVEIKMDAEISSYQEDFDPDRDMPRFAEPDIEVEARATV